MTKYLVLIFKLAVTLLNNAQLNTARRGKLDQRRVALANDEHIGGTGGKPLATVITNMDNVERSLVLLSVLHNTDTPQIRPPSDHALLPVLELGMVDNLVGFEVELDSVIDPDGRVGVTDGAAIMGDNEGDSLGSESPLLDLEELELKRKVQLRGKKEEGTGKGKGERSKKGGKIQTSLSSLSMGVVVNRPLVS